ncbi:hypothetical protein PR002_g14766 [Phytophthora rubi]|uniref:Uncharacterized protein n=1 Tax=Phytophthora rubi TaxID=129364 RepID=A0A6A3KYP6_9STRA|nr:hypothetical protein PR002_g14766 [Phytophthora rubi]
MQVLAASSLSSLDSSAAEPKLESPISNSSLLQLDIPNSRITASSELISSAPFSSLISASTTAGSTSDSQIPR